jgi:F-type H+-transporting ATPase subunit delta
VARGASARRYAQAIFELAQEADDFGQWSDGLALLNQLISQPEMLAYLQSAQVLERDKRTVLEQVLGATHPRRVNFGLLLATRGRLAALPLIAAQFTQMENDRLGISVAQVTTALPLSDSEATVVSEHLASITGKKITLQRSVDPSIIGGIIARIGDKLIDGSIASQLQALKRQMAQ